MSVRLRLVSLLFVVISFGAPAAGRDKISIRVSPTVSFAPAYLVVRASVPPSDENRSIEIVAESAEFYRSSQVPLDGARAPQTTQFEFRSLPGGDYNVLAVLRGAGGREIAWTTSRVNVVAAEGRR